MPSCIECRRGFSKIPGQPKWEKYHWRCRDCSVPKRTFNCADCGCIRTIRTLDGSIRFCGAYNVCARPLHPVSCQAAGCSVVVQSRKAQDMCSDCERGNTLEACVNCLKIGRKANHVHASCADCVNVTLTCAACKQPYPKYYNQDRSMLSNHQGCNCPMDVVTCPECLEMVQRSLLDGHCSPKTVVTLEVLARFLQDRDRSGEIEAYQIVSRSSRRNYKSKQNARPTCSNDSINSRHA